MFTRSKHLYSNQISGGVSDISSYQILTELIKERCLRDLHLVVLGFHLFVCIASGRSPAQAGSGSSSAGRSRSPEAQLMDLSPPNLVPSQNCEEADGDQGNNTCLRLSHCLRVL